MRLDDYAALGGHMEHVMTLQQALSRGAWQDDGAPTMRQWRQPDDFNAWPLGQVPMLG